MYIYLFNIFGDQLFDYCFYCVILLLLLLWFICSCTCTMTIPRQQQHETVTTTTTEWGHLILHVSQIWALQHSAIYVILYFLINRTILFRDTSTQLLNKEEKHLKNALKNCQYPTWAINKIQQKTNNPARKQTNNRNSNITQRSCIVVPYYGGLSKSIKNIGRKFGMQVHCKGGTTIKNLLMSPKDKDPIQKQSGVIYSYHCDRVDCGEEYIGESSRTFGERFKEHLKPPLPYMTIVTSVVTVLPSIISKLLGGRTWTRLGQ